MRVGEVCERHGRGGEVAAARTTPMLVTNGMLTADSRAAQSVKAPCTRMEHHNTADPLLTPRVHKMRVGEVYERHGGFGSRRRAHISDARHIRHVYGLEGVAGGEGALHTHGAPTPPTHCSRHTLTQCAFARCVRGTGGLEAAVARTSAMLVTNGMSADVRALQPEKAPRS